MRAEFIRSRLMEQTGGADHILQVYLDLGGDGGPLHARATYDAFECFVLARPAKAYQINTFSILRPALARELGEPRYDVTDPRALPADLRTERWETVCVALNRWSALGVGQQVTLATLLHKLGLWTALTGVAQPRQRPEHWRSTDEATLAALWCNARAKLSEPEADNSAAMVFQGIASNPQLPPSVRATAAVNFVVHLARRRADTAELTEWSSRAEAIRRGLPPAEHSSLQHSIFLRGLSFRPFVQGRVAEVRSMLDDAETAAREAVRDARVDPILAKENLHPLLETRAKEAEWSGRPDLAEERYRELTELDCDDAKTWVRLADFLRRRGHTAPARAAYLTAATLGAPFTAYALAQAARCSVDLHEPTRALAYAAAAARSDPRATTPLAMITDFDRPHPHSALRWVVPRLDELTTPTRHAGGPQ